MVSVKFILTIMTRHDPARIQVVTDHGEELGGAHLEGYGDVLIGIDHDEVVALTGDRRDKEVGGDGYDQQSRNQDDQGSPDGRGHNAQVGPVRIRIPVGPVPPQGAQSQVIMMVHTIWEDGE